MDTGQCTHRKLHHPCAEICMKMLIRSRAECALDSVHLFLLRTQMACTIYGIRLETSLCHSFHFGTCSKMRVIGPKRLQKLG